MKKIIFSQYNDNVDQNTISTNQYKLSQFRKYSNQLEQAQREYANRCDADYVLHKLDITDYDTLQFEKILLLWKSDRIVSSTNTKSALKMQQD